MPKSSTFQIIMILVFGFFAVVAVMVFAGVFPSLNGGNTGAIGEVVVWGTVPEDAVSVPFSEIMSNNKNFKITYVKKNVVSFDNDFIEALASGRGPDLIFLPQDLILKYEDKISPIPYSSISERNFKSTYIEEGELYLGANGILALPLYVDPMVMYWNRNMFSAAGIPNPPLFWDEFYVIAPRLIKKDSSENILESAIAFGEFKNVFYAKDILSMLMMQLGNTLVTRDAQKMPIVTILDRIGSGNRSADTALRFFTEFSDPAKNVYSWNKSLVNSRDSFLSERLAVYFGYASEIGSLRNKNSHLNFDVTNVPTPRTSKTKVNFGRINGVAIVKVSKNIGSALFLAGEMGKGAFVGALAENLYLPPVRRDLLAVRPKDSYLQFFYDNALISRAWLDPDPNATNQAFSEMVDNVVSGRYRVGDVTSIVEQELRKLLGQ